MTFNSSAPRSFPRHTFRTDPGLSYPTLEGGPFHLDSQVPARPPHVLTEDLVHSPVLIPAETLDDRSYIIPWGQDCTKLQWPYIQSDICDGPHLSPIWSDAAYTIERSSSASSMSDSDSFTAPAAARHSQPGCPAPGLVRHPRRCSSLAGGARVLHESNVSYDDSGATSANCWPAGNPLQQIQSVPDSYPEEIYPSLSPTEPAATVPCPYPSYSYPSPVSLQRGANDDGPQTGGSVMTVGQATHRGDEGHRLDHGHSQPATSSSRLCATPEGGPGAESPPTGRKTAPHASTARIKKRTPTRRGGATRQSSSTAGGNGKAGCSQCDTRLPNQTALQRHVAAVHTRPFTCSFNLYGCSATFGAKNEWKRHVTSQHLRLGFWRCDFDGCRAEASSQPKSPDHRSDTRGRSRAGGKGRRKEADARNGCQATIKGHEIADEEEVELVFNDFNRKDLFTQHVRRMHGPAKTAPVAQHNAFQPVITAASKRCFIRERDLPSEARCGFCAADQAGHAPGSQQEVVFRGPSAWETRMEHVGKHLEAARDADMKGGPSRQWVEDLALRKWLQDQGLLEGSAVEGWHLVGA